MKYLGKLEYQMIRQDFVQVVDYRITMRTFGFELKFKISQAS